MLCRRNRTDVFALRIVWQTRKLTPQNESDILIRQHKWVWHTQKTPQKNESKSYTLKNHTTYSKDTKEKVIDAQKTPQSVNEINSAERFWHHKLKLIRTIVHKQRHKIYSTASTGHGTTQWAWHLSHRNYAMILKQTYLINPYKSIKFYKQFLKRQFNWR